MTITHEWQSPMNDNHPWITITLEWQSPMNDNHTWMTITHEWISPMNEYHPLMTKHEWQSHMNDNHTWMTITHEWQSHMNDNHTWMIITHEWQNMNRPLNNDLQFINNHAMSSKQSNDFLSHLMPTGTPHVSNTLRFDVTFSSGGGAARSSFWWYPFFINALSLSNCRGGMPGNTESMLSFMLWGGGHGGWKRFEEVKGFFRPWPLKSHKSAALMWTLQASPRSHLAQCSPGPVAKCGRRPEWCQLPAIPTDLPQRWVTNPPMSEPTAWEELTHVMSGNEWDTRQDCVERIWTTFSRSSLAIWV